METIIAVVNSKGKREVGLVVLAKFIAYGENIKHAQILVTKLVAETKSLKFAVHDERNYQRISYNLVGISL